MFIAALFFFFSSFSQVACGIFGPQSGIKLTPPAVEYQSLNYWTSREVPQHYSFFFFFLALFLIAKN